MKKLLLLLTCLTVMLSVGCSSDDSGSSDETLVKGGYDKEEMAAATARAISEVDDFITELNSGKWNSYAVKAPIEDQGETEHFWLVDVKFADGKFTGRIDNDPGLVSNVKIGQDWTLGKTEISDWMYVKDGKMHGNYTLRPLLATMSDEDAAQYRAMLATP